MKLRLMWNEEKEKEFSERLEKILFERQEESVLHNSFLWNEHLYDVVCSGDEERLRDFMKREILLDGEAGTLARDRMRSARNLVICYIANLTYRMIRDQSLEVETAYAISDACIQLAEEAKTEQDLMNVAAVGCLEFCRCLKKQNSLYHPLVRQAREYIFKHFHEKIVIGQMAEQLGTSASWLGQIFRKSEGMTLHQFIMKEKLERGKNLLRYSDYDIPTISQYLGFASQSHFGKEFKAYTGETPAAFRGERNQMYREHI